ncbi:MULTISPECIES: uracil-xanthine permease family protein [Saliphagus]|uniref:Uracil-xanthine permease family protein n=1 Tax=Saliphagus infecundisoli TaxID=1849069 RepID=A0ABD5QJB4_9EURY|nr:MULTISPECIES: solute carrier family 23 protein [Saliphagus]
MAEGGDAPAGSADDESMVLYGVDDKPPLGQSILLGVQHWMTMVGSTIAIPLVLSGSLGFDAAQTAQLVGTFFVVSGVATLAQTTVGNRYPIVQGGTFSMLGPAIAIIGVLATSDASSTVMMRELQGAIIVAGLVEVAIGYFGLFGRLKKYMGPIVIAVVISLIGLALLSVGQITSATQNWYLAGLTLALIVLFSQYLNARSKVFKLFPVLLGLGAAYLIAVVVSVAGIANVVDLSPVASAPPVRGIVPFQWGMPLFTGSFIVGMLAGMLASAIESFGDYHSVARMAGEGAPNKKRINHGLGMEGIGNVFAGIMGTGNGSTSYTENVGAIGITGVASRYVVQIGAVVMIIVGYVGYFGAFVTTIPDPIVGGLFLAMFAQIVGVGLSQLQHVDMNQNRNVFVVGFGLFAGLSIPQYVANVQASDVSFEAGLAGVPVLGSVLGIPEVASTISIVLGTEIAVGGIAAFVLDNTIPGTKEERGLTAWEEITEDETAFEPFHERYLSDDGSADRTVGDD